MWFLKKKKPMIEFESGDWYFSFKRMEAWIPDSLDVQGVVHLMLTNEKLGHKNGVFFEDEELQKELDEAYRKYVEVEFEDIVLIGPT